MTLRLVGIGGMGLMLSPSARHLQAGGPAKFLRIHDRGTQDDRRNACREAWKAHGADVVTDYQTLIGDGDFDGVVICAGKNGDDCDIFRAIVPLMQAKKQEERPAARESRRRGERTPRGKVIASKGPFADPGAWLGGRHRSGGGRAPANVKQLRL